MFPDPVAEMRRLRSEFESAALADRTNQGLPPPRAKRSAGGRKAQIMNVNKDLEVGAESGAARCPIPAPPALCAPPPTPSLTPLVHTRSLAARNGGPRPVLIRAERKAAKLASELAAVVSCSPLLRARRCCCTPPPPPPPPPPCRGTPLTARSCLVRTAAGAAAGGDLYLWRAGGAARAPPDQGLPLLPTPLSLALCPTPPRSAPPSHSLLPSLPPRRHVSAFCDRGCCTKCPPQAKKVRAPRLSKAASRRERRALHEPVRPAYSRRHCEFMQNRS